MDPIEITKRIVPMMELTGLVEPPIMELTEQIEEPIEEPIMELTKRIEPLTESTQQTAEPIELIQRKMEPIALTKPKVLDLVTLSPSTRHNTTNLENYIILPEKSHSGYSYPDLLIHVNKIYLNHNWSDSHNFLNANNSFMLPLRAYVDFLNLLIYSSDVYDGLGKKINKLRIDYIISRIFPSQNSQIEDENQINLSGEWLDAKFFMDVNNNKSSIAYNKINYGVLEKIVNPIQDYLHEDKISGIDLNYWLNNATVQGLPPRNNPNGKLLYKPTNFNGNVARFGIVGNKASLNCLRFPDTMDSWLGVRPARIRG